MSFRQKESTMKKIWIKTFKIFLFFVVMFSLMIILKKRFLKKIMQDSRNLSNRKFKKHIIILKKAIMKENGKKI